MWVGIKTTDVQTISHKLEWNFLLNVKEANLKNAALYLLALFLAHTFVHCAKERIKTQTDSSNFFKIPNGMKRHQFSVYTRN